MKASQAKKNFENGNDCYTFYGTDAKSIIASTYLFSRTYTEIHAGTGMFWYAMNRHLHSFYGYPQNI